MQPQDDVQPQDDDRSRQRIAENWQAVSQRVADAAKISGRDRSDVKIIGVTKYVDAATTAMLVDSGCDQLGESRPQLLWQKAETLELPESTQWHLIGHLQTNKVRRLLRHQVTIHSVDSGRLLQRIVDETFGHEFKTRVLLEVNVSGDSKKTGMDIQALRETIANTYPPTLDSVDVCGLMAMAGQGAQGADARRQFARLRQLMDQMNEEFGLTLRELSMGMSRDYVEAIAEGATMVRIGSALFEGVKR